MNKTSDIIFTALGALWFLVKIVAATVVLSCIDDDCSVGALRCYGDKLQICDGSSYWETFDDCKKEYNEKCCPVGDADYDCQERCE